MQANTIHPEGMRPRSMQRYEIGLVPGPVSIPAEVLAAYSIDFGSADMEEEFFELYEECQRMLQRILVTGNQIAIQNGEGMLALWGGLKSVLCPDDRVLAVANGVFGYGIADMAREIGMEVEVVGFGYDDVPDPQQVREAALRFRPRLITAVHCETPSGTLSSLAEVGEVAREVDALFYVDMVASGGGTEVRVDDWQIDLGLLGSQKVLSLMPDLCMVTVSERAWSAVERVQYVGYDALFPWRTGVADRYLPYTHNWQAMAGLRLSVHALVDEGLNNVFKRHADVAALARRRLKEMGVALFPKREGICASTVTAARMPDGWTWPHLDAALRVRGMVVGGSYGPLAGQVFRIGHMGSQANEDLVGRGMDVLADVLGR